jgi:hypothetical protein
MACSRGVRPFWGLMDLQIAPSIVLVVWDATTSSTICFFMCGVCLNTCIIQHIDTLTITLIDYGVRLSIKLGFCWPH